MSKSYSEFMDEITSEELYEKLISFGFFAERLPPLFNSESFYNYCTSMNREFSDRDMESIVFYVTRNNNVPRLIGIPTPMTYQRLCKEIADDWEEIKEHFHKQTDNQSYRISRIHIRKKEKSDKLFEMNYKNYLVDGNPETDLLYLKDKTSKYIVKADISTCFPSIYTHSIPWALVGKDVAKNNRQNKEYYNRLDKACRKTTNGETHGLLIGPHTSNILSEIILTVIDKQLYEKGFRFYRNIDDYDCYVQSYSEGQSFLKALEEELRQYGLILNHKKTDILSAPMGITKNWIHQLNNIPLGSYNGSSTYKDVNRYIDCAINLAEKIGDNAVINYAIKTLARKKMTDNAQKLAAKRFMHLALLFPYLLHLMDQYVFGPYEVNIKDIEMFANNVYREATLINNEEGICYSIYFSLKYNFKLTTINLDEIIDRKDPIALTAAWMYYSKWNNSKSLSSDMKKLKNLAKQLRENEMCPYWIFIYETLSFGLLKDDWKDLKKAGVSFLDQTLLQ